MPQVRGVFNQVTEAGTPIQAEAELRITDARLAREHAVMRLTASVMEHLIAPDR